MSEEKRRRKKKIIRFKRKNNRVYKIGGFVLLVVVTLFVLMLTPLFNAKWIDIQGAQRVAFSEIENTISYKQGINIFRLNLSKAEKKLLDIPYIETASVHRKLPDGIRVKITERTPVAYIEYGGTYALCDKTGRLLEQIKDKPLNLAQLTGAPTEGLKIGQSIGDKSEAALNAFTVLYDKLIEYQIYERVTGIDVKNTDNLSFMFDGNKKVVIGDGYRLDYKMMMLQATIEDLAPSEEGTITLTVEGKAIFTPDNE
ncbi:MAG: FtsQ-type POTRA domain-containing protein [Clostridia bacterium]|nr:FtsQ-type POTRA domain-containing protein [Clostridia bacterium]